MFRNREAPLRRDQRHIPALFYRRLHHDNRGTREGKEPSAGIEIDGLRIHWKVISLGLLLVTLSSC